jgi:DNA (cytosine-5)-methyltransferase 1
VRIGELFAGYGGLGIGVQAAIGGDIAWFSEFDEAPSKILAHHFPGIPNHGDITKIDWSTVEPVDVLTGGFPCQDVSLAGARKGLKEGTRSGLWSYFAEAISALKPGLVVIENVRGLLSAEASGPMEPDPWGLGNGTDGPSLRAIGAVLGDLSELGYDAQWCGVRAADAGAPHGRFRVFILAHPNDNATGNGREPGHTGRRTGEPAQHSRPTENTDITVGDQRRITTPRQTERGRTRADTGRRGGTSVTDTDDDRLGQQQPRRLTAEQPRVADTAELATKTDRDGFESIGRLVTAERDADRRDSAHIAWGNYEPAIRRWEHMSRRTAPTPTLPNGRGGGHRLSARFVEWMMGLEPGWVTDPAIGLTRNQQLKALGNGVVPQQATLAMRTLLARQEAAA